MGSAPTLLASDGTTTTVQRIAELMRTASLEATRLSDDELAALASTAPAGTPIYLSALPARPPDAEIAAARKLRGAGFEPVPHLAARNFASVAALERFLERMAAEARVQRVLVIAGDLDRPSGPFASAVEVIERGLLQRHGIREIGVAAHPDGHPRLSSLELDRALLAKVDAAQQTGLAVHVVTQFCFDAGPIVAWLERLRELGLDLPVRIGLAGPTSLSTLLRYAQRCGVKASAQGFARRAGLVKQMFSTNAPDRIIRALAEVEPERLGDVALHFFSFGGLAATARWAAAVAAGRIVFESDGFEVAPPHRTG